MFENILYQNNVITRLKNDIGKASLAPSILFSGPEFSGKGTTALELARVLGCEDDAGQGNWNCSCTSCKLHRNLVSPDLILLGKKHFFAECSASAGAFLRQTDNAGCKMLFIRSVRKLLARFNSILWEDDQKFGKLKSQIEGLEEELEDIELMDENPEKKCQAIIKKAVKLEKEGFGTGIPLAQIRKAAYWCRMAPLGRHKCVIMENAEHMQEGAKNSLLKILEEPPAQLTIILTSSSPMILLPTIVSRLREYQFARRSAEAQDEIIKRIFRENSGGLDKTAITIKSYLASFLPVNSETLYSLGAFFITSVVSAPFINKTALVLDLRTFAASLAKEGGMGLPGADCKTTVEKIMTTAEHFEIPGLFKRFLQQCCAVLSAWLVINNNNRGSVNELSLERALCAEHWQKELNQSIIEQETFNISPELVLEGLFERLKTGM